MKWSAVVGGCPRTTLNQPPTSETDMTKELTQDLGGCGGGFRVLSPAPQEPFFLFPETKTCQKPSGRIYPKQPPQPPTLIYNILKEKRLPLVGGCRGGSLSICLNHPTTVEGI